MARRDFSSWLYLMLITINLQQQGGGPPTFPKFGIPHSPQERRVAAPGRDSRGAT